MKKTLAIILSLAICMLTGCHSVEAPTEPSESALQTQPALETSSTVPVTEAATVPPTEKPTDPTEASTAHTAEQQTLDETVPETTTPQATVPTETVSMETQTQETEPEEANPPATKETTIPETAPAETETTELEPTETEVATEPATEPEEFVPDYAYKRQVAAYVAQYINQYRASPCTVLSGMSQVAQYRAGQLCYNFSHSTSDKRAALAYYEYGRWIDATEAGLDASLSYYEADTAEAICRGQRGLDPEALGKAIATAIKNSGSHWSYVGSSEYSYIGVGVEYRDDAYGWYCCVMVGTVDYG